MTFRQLFEKFKDGKPFYIISGQGDHYAMNVLEFNKDNVIMYYEQCNAEDPRVGVADLFQGELDAVCNYSILDWFEESESKCECGAESIGVNAHSFWCGKVQIA